MNKKIFDTLNELENFINNFEDEPVYIFDIQKLETGQGFLLQWQEQKYYTALDGKQYPDEVWTTKEGNSIQVQDIELDHLRNILRMMIRRNREYSTALAEAMRTLMIDSDDELDTDPDTGPVTLH